MDGWYAGAGNMISDASVWRLDGECGQMGATWWDDVI